MNNYAEKIITPDDLLNKIILPETFIIKKTNEVLLTGTVYNPYDEPVEGAVVEIVEIIERDQRTLKGYVITNKYGEFAIIVDKNNHIDYQLIIYEPITAK